MTVTRQRRARRSSTASGDVGAQLFAAWVDSIVPNPMTYVGPIHHFPK